MSCGYLTTFTDRYRDFHHRLLGQIASSHGELTLQFETLTLRQHMISMPSRSVSIFRLSIVRLSTPVTSTPKWPPFRMEKSRRITLCALRIASDLFPTPATSANGGSCRPLLSPLPQIRPGPMMPTLLMPSPQMRLL